MTGTGIPMGILPSAPSAAGFGGDAGVPPSPASPPPGFDPSMMSGPPAPPAADLASMIAQALEQAQSVVSGLQSAQDATMHPVVQAMMQGADPMRGMTGDVSGMGMPQDPGMGYQ